MVRRRGRPKKDDPRTQDTRRYSLTVDSADLDALKAVAQDLGVDASVLVRDMLAEFNRDPSLCVSYSELRAGGRTGGSPVTLSLGSETAARLETLAQQHSTTLREYATVILEAHVEHPAISPHLAAARRFLSKR